MTGFGIPNLVDMVRELMAKGHNENEAMAEVSRQAELRSEAIEALRNALQQTGVQSDNQNGDA